MVVVVRFERNEANHGCSSRFERSEANHGCSSRFERSEAEHAVHGKTMNTGPKDQCNHVLKLTLPCRFWITSLMLRRMSSMKKDSRFVELRRWHIQLYVILRLTSTCLIFEQTPNIILIPISDALTLPYC